MGISKEPIWVIAFILVLAMRSLKMVEWGIIVGPHPTITPHFYSLDVRNA
jgi:hypothetical protein